MSAQVQSETILSRDTMLQELLSWCNLFVQRSSEWRRNSFEVQWRRWQRNSDAIYDPGLKSKKEYWQATAFVPITPSHRENAQAQLYRTEVGPNPPLEIKARKGVPLQIDQSENIRDLILREREKSRYNIERNKVLEDKTTYGSGFARLRFETVTDDRQVMEPVLEPIDVFRPDTILRAMTGQRQVVGYQPTVKKVQVYRGCRFEHISIWDFFPDPRSLKIKGSPCAYRYEQTLEDIVNGIRSGYNIPEAYDKLKDYDSDEETPIDKRVVESDRGITSSATERTDYQKKFKCYELFARLPKKWVFVNGEPIDDPEALVPAIIRFHKASVVGIALNDSYDGEPQIFKDDYIPVAGQFYGRGIPEMLKDTQDISNETTNQRLDTGSIALRQRFGIIEKAIVDPKDLEEDRNVIRLKNPSGLNDIRQVIMRLDMGTIPSWAFMEPQEWERMAQERTSITRMTLGTAGQVKDANQTLGGMELLKAATGDKIAYIGMLSEYDFQYEINRAYWRQIYQNYQPQDYALALGPERAATMIPMSPEEVENNYQYYPTGVYTMENKAMRVMRLAQIDQQFGMMPWFNRVEIAKSELHASDEDPAKFIASEAEGMQIMMKAQQMAAGMAHGMAQQAIQQHMANQKAEQPGEKKEPKKEPQDQEPPNHQMPMPMGGGMS